MSVMFLQKNAPVLNRDVIGSIPSVHVPILRISRLASATHALCVEIGCGVKTKRQHFTAEHYSLLPPTARQAASAALLPSVPSAPCFHS